MQTEKQAARRPRPRRLLCPRQRSLLPVPSVFIAATDGVIRFAHSNPDYKVRLGPEKVVEAAQQAVR